MYLVDSEIREMCAKNQLIVEEYNADNVGAISYDLEIDHIILKPEKRGSSLQEISYGLKPGEVVFVKTREKINIPNDFIGVVSEKNSVMREGLAISAPVYQPGHKTFCYIRVQNISNSEIQLRNGKKIAQIMFSRLSKVPDVPYSQNENASFNEENEYIGFGRYEREYKKEIKKIQKMSDDLESKIQSVYSNVLVLMGIIAAIFSMITINFEAFRNTELSMQSIFTMNLSFVFVVSFLMGLILTFTNKFFQKAKVIIPYWSIVAIALVANILLLFVF